MITQPRIPGILRLPKGSSLLPKLAKAVEKEAKRWDCSPSFVIATALGYALGVDEQADYKKVRKVRRPRKIDKIIRFRKSA